MATIRASSRSSPGRNPFWLLIALLAGIFVLYSTKCPTSSSSSAADIALLTKGCRCGNLAKQHTATQCLMDFPDKLAHSFNCTAPTPDQCRDVFRGQGQGGAGELTPERIARACSTPSRFNVCQDLLDFTGLTQTELDKRMSRKGRFHYEGEHAFWNPSSATELTWYYSTSVNYLFGNSIHGVRYKRINPLLDKKYEPVLDYSGGAGNSILFLASQGIKCQYFGVGMMEFAFAQYRVHKRGLDDNVTFLRPYAAHTGWKFDPIGAPLRRDQSLGSIIAMDVLEHIPNYHHVVEAMVDSIRVGGVIVENTPFTPLPTDGGEGETDVRVHLSDGGVDMEKAMGPRMKFVKEMNYWEKISE